MSRLREYVSRAGRELGVRVIAPFELRLDSGRTIVAEALVPELGAPRGMIVFGAHVELLEFEAELVAMGYGYSVMMLEADESYERGRFEDAFRDWGVGAAEPGPGAVRRRSSTSVPP